MEKLNIEEHLIKYPKLLPNESNLENLIDTLSEYDNKSIIKEGIQIIVGNVDIFLFNDELDLKILIFKLKIDEDGSEVKNIELYKSNIEYILTDLKELLEKD